MVWRGPPWAARVVLRELALVAWRTSQAGTRQAGTFHQQPVWENRRRRGRVPRAGREATQCAHWHSIHPLSTSSGVPIPAFKLAKFLGSGPPQVMFKGALR